MGALPFGCYRDTTHNRRLDLPINPKLLITPVAVSVLDPFCFLNILLFFSKGDWIKSRKAYSCQSLISISIFFCPFKAVSEACRNNWALCSCPLWKVLWAKLGNHASVLQRTAPLPVNHRVCFSSCHGDAVEDDFLMNGDGGDYVQMEWKVVDKSRWKCEETNIHE